MKITHVTVGPFQENSYLVVDETTNDAVLVDPGDSDPRVLRMLQESGATLRAIWLTHGHVDHIGGIAAVKRLHDVPVHLHKADRVVYDAQEFYAEAYNIPFEPPPPPDTELVDGGTVSFGSLTFDVTHVPGHAPGHVMFSGHGVVLGGDLLFAGSIGRTDLPLGNPTDMTQSLTKIAALPPETVVYAGHGPQTTVGTELQTNPFLNGTANVKRNV